MKILFKFMLTFLVMLCLVVGVVVLAYIRDNGNVDTHIDDNIYDFLPSEIDAIIRDGDTIHFGFEYGDMPARVINLGDVTGNGNVDRADLIRLAQHILDSNVWINYDAADIDGDGFISSNDLHMLARFFAQPDFNIGSSVGFESTSGADLTFTVEPGLESEQGHRVRVGIYVTGNSSGFASAGLQIEYNPAQLSLHSIPYAEIPIDNFMRSTAPGVQWISFVRLPFVENWYGDGRFVTLDFNVLQDAPIGLAPINISLIHRGGTPVNLDEELIGTAFVNGTVNIVENNHPTPTPPPIEPDDYRRLTVNLHGGVGGLTSRNIPITEWVIPTGPENKPIKVGYTFLHWSLVGNGPPVTTIASDPAGRDVELHAAWIADSGNGGGAPPSPSPPPSLSPSPSPPPSPSPSPPPLPSTFTISIDNNEREGIIGMTRTITVTPASGANTSGLYLLVQITETAVGSRPSAIAIQLQSTSANMPSVVSISYQQSGATIDVWLFNTLVDVNLLSPNLPLILAHSTTRNFGSVPETG